MVNEKALSRNIYCIINILLAVSLANAGIIYTYTLYLLLPLVLGALWIYLRVKTDAGSTVRLRMLKTGDEDIIAFLTALPLTALVGYLVYSNGIHTEFIVFVVLL